MTDRTARPGNTTGRNRKNGPSSAPPQRMPSDLAPRKVPKQGRALATFASILDAAAALIVKDGLTKPTTNHIAERSGANIGSLYQYFGSKEAIIAALVDRALVTYETAMTTGFAAVRDLALHDGFESLVLCHVAALEQQAPLLRVLLKHLDDVDRKDAYRATKGRMVEAFTAYVEAHAHETHVADVTSASRMMVDCVEAITMDALFDRGEALADDPRVHELLCVARRYFLLRA